MKIQSNVSLAPYTSFGVGGPAEHFALVETAEDLEEALRCTLPSTQLWVLGYGSNSLVSGEGLSGMTICVRGGAIRVEGDRILVDAGAWWDDVVKTAIDHKLWGIELMSEVPGSVGGALFINITAYGQSIGSRVEWVEVWDRDSSQVKRLLAKDLSWGYKSSLFQTEAGKKLVVLRACLKLSKSPLESVQYEKALDVAKELKLDLTTLEGRRTTIIEARKRAGSLWHPNSTEAKTVGSFFRNPIVSAEKARLVMQYDESGKTADQIKKMNRVHGGDEQRVSAAHVMLAAGFKRGQSWGEVKLNDKNLLKIEASPKATAQKIYEVMRIIQNTCRDKLGIDLEPEARILGSFQP